MARPPNKPGKPPRKPPRFHVERDTETPMVSAEEAAATFSHAVTPETYLAVYNEVLDRWQSTCAITGRRFRSKRRPHPHLEVVAIRPLDLGGPLHASNFLPLTSAAARAFQLGHIVIDDSFGMWAGLARIDPELLESVVPLGKLVLPDDSADWPDVAQVRWHRIQVLGVAVETA
jgi:hypothetical protein